MLFDKTLKTLHIHHPFKGYLPGLRLPAGRAGPNR